VSWHFEESSIEMKTNGLLNPQSFIPESMYSSKEMIYEWEADVYSPKKRCCVQFPTDYEDTGQLGKRLWDELMPCKSS
jgi:hypothetical protein